MFYMFTHIGSYLRQKQIFYGKKLLRRRNRNSSQICSLLGTWQFRRSHYSSLFRKAKVFAVGLLVRYAECTRNILYIFWFCLLFLRTNVHYIPCDCTAKQIVSKHPFSHILLRFTSLF